MGAGVGSPPAFEGVVVAASAGGLSAIAALLASLPSDFPLPIAIVQHMHPDHLSRIPEILRRRTTLKVKQAEDGEVMTGGVVYVASPNSHLMIGGSLTVQLGHGAPVHFLRPSADRLFESAADTCGAVIAVILTGTGTDGAAGATAIKASGGVIIAQDEATSAFFGMPQAAIGTGAVDFVLPLGAIGPRLLDLTRALS
jgi:two-component system chemotaxis response regulator CheB